MGPRTKAADALHAMKYRGEGEDFREAMQRVAFGLSDSGPHYHELREILLHQRFLPGGRIQSAIGSTRQVTAINCFVSGPIEDTFVGDGIWEHDTGSIMRRSWEAAQTMRMGGGIGYDFSTLRPRRDLIKSQQTQASGPTSFMEIFNAICLATASAGHRRGAQMGVLRVDHPDIEEFVRAKQNDIRFKGFNVSVAVTDEFMECVDKGTPFMLKWGGRDYREIDPQALWELIMRSAWDWAEPGVLFIDTINRMNNLWYCETIAATNPCGEQPLPPFGQCLLGSFNLPAYLTTDAEGRWSLDRDLLKHDIPIVVRAMDNVIERTRYPLAEQRAEALAKRRMGLGVTGLANCIEALGCKPGGINMNNALYGGGKFLDLELVVLRLITLGAYRASIELAKEKGPFPALDIDRYLESRFVQKVLSPELQGLIKIHGIRNSHLTSIAPTGTISMCADNVSGGLEPIFSYATTRSINTPDGSQVVTVNDYGAEFLGVKGRLAGSVSAAEHVNVLRYAQIYIDSAVSKTCNVDKGMEWEDFKGLYRMAWEGGAKGCTTFNQDGKRMALLTAGGEDGTTCTIDPNTGAKECL